jgi:hypothetical protein
VTELIGLKRGLFLAKKALFLEIKGGGEEQSKSRSLEVDRPRGLQYHLKEKSIHGKPKRAGRKVDPRVGEKPPPNGGLDRGDSDSIRICIGDIVTEFESI